MEDPSLKSWDEVNAALKLIRDNEIELELIEADMGKKIADIKEQAAEQAVPYRDDIKKLELQVKEFVTLNKADKDYSPTTMYHDYILPVLRKSNG